MYHVDLRRTSLKDLKELPADYLRLIANHIDLLGGNPRPHNAKKLKGDAGYSLRIGAYRVLYDINDKTQIVTIYRVKHRREAYR